MFEAWFYALDGTQRALPGSFTVPVLYKYLIIYFESIKKEHGKQIGNLCPHHFTMKFILRQMIHKMFPEFKKLCVEYVE